MSACLAIVGGCLACTVAGLQAQAVTPRAQLQAAQTAQLVNAGGNAGTFKDLTAAFQQWGRFTLVEDGAPSDITITLGGLHIGRGWPLTITGTATHAVLWTDRQKKELWSRASWGGGLAGAFVGHLREQLEGTP